MDRQPQEAPHDISEIATNVAEDVDQRVLNHWLGAKRLCGKHRVRVMRCVRRMDWNDLLQTVE